MTEISRCSKTALILLTLSICLLCGEAHARTDGVLSAWFGGSYAHMLEKTGSGKADMGGFALDLTGTIWAKKFLGLRYDMLQIEGIFGKDLSWFHIGGNFGIVLDFRYVHLTTGAGLFLNRLKVKGDGDTSFRVPAGVGFRWPVEVGVSFWRIGLYGGLQFDFIAAKHRVSLNSLLGDETTAFGGLRLNFGDKGVRLDLRYNFRMLDDDAGAHAVFLLVDLVSLIRKAGDEKHDGGGGGGDDGYTPLPPDETPYVPPAETYSSALEKSVASWLDALDVLDDTMSNARMEKAVKKSGFDNLYDTQELDGVPVMIVVPDSLEQIFTMAFTDDACEDMRALNSAEVVLAYCYDLGESGIIDENDLDAFWKASTAALGDQYGQPAGGSPSPSVGGWAKNLWDTHTTGHMAYTYATRSTTKPWVTLEIGIEEWVDSDTASFVSCIYYTPKVGSCAAPPNNQIMYGDVMVPVVPPWHSPGCDMGTSCAVDNLELGYTGDILQPWKCESDAVFAKMLDDDAKFVGVSSQTYTTRTWTYLGLPTEVRVYENPGHRWTILSTQRTGGKCYTAVFTFYGPCASCEDDIREVVEGIKAPGAPSPVPPPAPSGPVTWNGLVMPFDPAITVTCDPLTSVCQLMDMKTGTIVMIFTPMTCTTDDQIAISKATLLFLGTEESHSTATWQFLGSPGEAFIFASDDAGINSVGVHQIHDGKCYSAALTYASTCTLCEALGKKMISMVKTATP